MRFLAGCIAAALALGACANDETAPVAPEPATTTEPQAAPTTTEADIDPDADTQRDVTLYPDVLSATATQADDGTGPSR